jgi:hypothetical protein
MMRRRRPTLMVFTRPALMSAHIVVLPTPTSLQAVFTGTASGFMPSWASLESAVLQILIASLSFEQNLPRAAAHAHDEERKGANLKGI